MGYRDDYEAALARVEALERDLERERSDDAEQKQQLAELKAELEKAKSELEKSEAELAKYRPPSEPEPPASDDDPKDASEQPKPTMLLAGVVVALIAMLVIGVLATSSKNSEYAEEDDDTDTVSAVPRVAEKDAVAGYLVEATRRAHAKLPIERMVGIVGTGITAEGELHPEYGEVSFQFIQHNPKPEPVVDPDRPIGAPPPPQPEWEKYSCLRVVRRPDGWNDTDIMSDYCMFPEDLWRRTGQEPSCTMKTIWRAALADGAPKGAIANIVFDGSSWTFEIDDERARFSETYPDNCRQPE